MSKEKSVYVKVLETLVAIIGEQDELLRQRSNPSKETYENIIKDIKEREARNED